MTTNIDGLDLLGLSEAEQKVFLTILEYGNLTAYQIHKILNTQRTSIYSYLQTLVNKKLIIENKSQNKTTYHALDNEKIKTLIQSKISSLKKLRKELPTVRKQLKKSSDNPLDNLVYQGMHGLQELADEIARFNGTVYFLGSMRGIDHIFNQEYFEKKYYKLRHKRNNEDFMISDWAESTINFFHKESELFTKRRFLPQNIKVNGSYIIFGDKVATIIYSPTLMATVTDEPTLAELQKLSFNALWNEIQDKNIPPTKLI